MKKINFNIFMLLKNKSFLIDFAFYLHLTLGYFIVSFISYKFGISYELNAFIWLCIFFPIFIAKIYKDLKKKG